MRTLRPTRGRALMSLGDLQMTQPRTEQEDMQTGPGSQGEDQGSKLMSVTDTPTAERVLRERKSKWRQNKKSGHGHVPSGVG